jgi:hypothetical protein
MAYTKQDLKNLPEERLQEMLDFINGRERILQVMGQKLSAESRAMSNMIQDELERRDEVGK